jgi:hypothetical protein
LSGQVDHSATSSRCPISARPCAIDISSPPTGLLSTKSVCHILACRSQPRLRHSLVRFAKMSGDIPVSRPIMSACSIRPMPETSVPTPAKLHDKIVYDPYGREPGLKVLQSIVPRLASRGDALRVSISRYRLSALVF